MTVQLQTEKHLVTAEELLRMPDDGFRYELVEGGIKQMTPAGGGHGASGMNLGIDLGHFVRKNRLGQMFLAETGFKIQENPDTVIAPDISFISRARILEEGIPNGFIPGAPDLVVEVVSPNDRVYEVDEKADKWLDAGVQLVWIVNPKRRTIEVRTASESTLLGVNDELSGEDVVPGFTCRVADIFA